VKILPCWSVAIRERNARRGGMAVVRVRNGICWKRQGAGSEPTWENFVEAPWREEVKPDVTLSLEVQTLVGGVGIGRNMRRIK
jgi:hypothetical protein